MTFTHECGLIVYKSSTASCKLKQIGEIIMHMVNRKQSQNLKVLVFEKQHFTDRSENVIVIHVDNEVMVSSSLSEEEHLNPPSSAKTLLKLCLCTCHLCHGGMSADCPKETHRQGNITIKSRMLPFPSPQNKNTNTRQ